LCISRHDDLYNRFVETIGRPDLVDDPRFCTFANCLKNDGNHKFTLIIQEQLSQKDADEWVDIFTNADLTIEKAYNFHEINSDPQALENDYVREISFASGNKGVVFPSPIKLKNAGRPEFEPTKSLGFHNEKYLKELGYTDEEIAGFRAEKICAG